MKNIKKGSIVFKNLSIDGKHQKVWFKVFDLLDKIFADEEKENMFLSIKHCNIKNFRFIGKELPEGTTKREFALWVNKQVKDRPAIAIPCRLYERRNEVS